MFSYPTFHLINDTVTITLAIIANATLLHLSLHIRDTVLAGYRRMLVTVCGLEILYIFCYALSQHHVDFLYGHGLVVVTTPLRHLGWATHYILIFLHVMVLGTAAITMLLEYYFRYVLICR